MGDARWHEPTEAELDALVAEQSRPENLPAWWWRDAARQEELARRRMQTVTLPLFAA